MKVRKLKEHKKRIERENIIKENTLCPLSGDDEADAQKKLNKHHNHIDILRSIY